MNTRYLKTPCPNCRVAGVATVTANADTARTFRGGKVKRGDRVHQCLGGCGGIVDVVKATPRKSQPKTTARKSQPKRRASTRRATSSSTRGGTTRAKAKGSQEGV